MLENLIAFSIRHRVLVLFAVLALCALGIYNFQRLPIDAVPDITNVQVQINTEAPGFSPLEVEQRITFPLETELSGIPELEYTRSLSRYGLSQITVVFADGANLYLARQLIGERLAQARGGLPEGLEPALAPVSTGLGEIFHYTVEAKSTALKPDGSPYTPMDLRTLQDWVIKPQLRLVPGVVEINSIGGYQKQYHVLPDVQKLAQFGLRFEDLQQALIANNSSQGAGFIDRNGEQLLVRSPGQIASLDDIRNVVIQSRAGTPIHISDVAEVAIGKELRTGAATQKGEEVVLGTAMMLIGENSRTVSKAIAAKLIEVQSSLPAGVSVHTAYDRTALVDRTIATVEKNLLEGALLVIVVLFVLLGNLRAALITASVIPIAMLMTITGMVQTRTSGNLMSLGALDFGLIVDGAVIIVENCLMRFGQAQQQLGRLLRREERFALAAKAASEVISPAMFGVFIITVVYVPIFALSGIEGKLFHPMALTVVIALVSAMILSLTFVPAAVALMVTGKVAEHENVAVAFLKRTYAPLLKLCMRWRKTVVAGALACVVLGVFGASRLGTEFIPNLDEGDLAAQVMRVSGTSLESSLQLQRLVDRAALTLPEVRDVFTRLGTSDLASDPMPPGIGDMYVMLKPRPQWPQPRKTREQLMEELEQALMRAPGGQVEISQPIQLRVNELISGVRSDVAIKIYGDDMAELTRIGNEIAKVLTKVPGAQGVKVEALSGLPMLSVEPKRAVLARVGLSVSDVQAALATAIAGGNAGLVFEGDQRFALQVRLPEYQRSDLEALKRLPLLISGDGDAAEFIPLGEAAELIESDGPNQISRENGKRRLAVSCNVRGRDLGSFITELKTSVGTVKLPSGYWIGYGGTFEQLQSAKMRLMIVVPVALALIFLLLFAAFGSAKDAWVIFSGVPLALVGGVAALALRDLPLSITAGVGFIALSGVAVLNGVVMLSYINSLRSAGRTLHEAVTEGALGRFRAVFMTALVAALGFVPMALNVGAGSEVQRPLATVVIGGIFSATVLTLLVLPALYSLLSKEEIANEQ